MITDKLAAAYRSDRLLYRAVNGSEDEKDFLHTHIENDPVIAALADPAMLRPRGFADVDRLIEGLKRSTLAVMICLPGRDNIDEKAEGKVATPTPIGFILLGWGGTPQFKAQHRSANIGIALAAAFQGRGYGTESLNWILDWAFRFGGYHRVFLSTVSYNERGLRLYRKLGFVEEGRSRESHWHDRQWYDTVNFGILEHEWAAKRGLTG